MDLHICVDLQGWITLYDNSIKQSWYIYYYDILFIKVPGKMAEENKSINV